MRKFFFAARLFPGVLVLLSLMVSAHLIAQPAKSKLQKAYQQFQFDPQLRHATSSLYVINARTGEVVFDKNSQVGLAPASTQKVITATTAFELLGEDYRYKTIAGYSDPPAMSHTLPGDLFVKGSGDPTLASFRFPSQNKNQFFESIYEGLRKNGIDTIAKRILIYSGGFEINRTPGGWIWEDIGNYYGAGSSFINWRENQFDVVLSSPDELDQNCPIKKMIPNLSSHLTLKSLVTSGNKGSGDNANIYLGLNSDSGFITGTIPRGEKEFTISGSIPQVETFLGDTLTRFLVARGIVIKGKPYTALNVGNKNALPVDPVLTKQLVTNYSPALDSIIYWFLQKSINLYGEALIKTLGYEKKGFGSTDSGVAVVRDFWKQKGIDPDELNIRDGSGLSPQNRVTTHAQVEVLRYAAKQSWFPNFFAALPETNHMKMKSGTISDVKGFCGYHTAGDGTQYIFSFLVNNYSGSTSAVVQKMYKVLDALK
jgi:D-alanyl-D-alanine carboxypeptidase/D-alanyl-D-alanine-endopeptidase (penicillin-binding protein 4)